MKVSSSVTTRVPEDWCVQRSEYPRNESVHGLFDQQARRSPFAIAISHGPEELSYQELNDRADRVAALLIRSGVEQESAVALVMRRSPQMIAGMLGVLKAGGTYVPVDESCPAARLRLILEDAGVRIALTDEANRRRLENIPVTALSPAMTAEEDMLSAVTATKRSAGPLSRAYIMYTSGSTGTPKGVEVVHRGIVRLVRNTNYVKFGPSDVVAQVANPAFDAITFEVWGALLNGSRLAILDSETILSPRAFADAIATQGITTMFLTSSLFSVMASTVPDAFGKMRTLVVGGDAVNPEAARAVLAQAPPQKLVNGYGPTECTTFSVCHWIRSVPSDAKSIPIGSPISNSEAFILDDDLASVRLGEAGDLYLGGDGLARGYLKHPELTAERFLSHPFDDTPGARLYKTGDRARYLEDGTIEFLGRRDHQVKFHGFRIELGEIESALRRHPEVTDAVVKVVRTSTHDDRLAGYVAVRESARVSEVVLRNFLEQILPKYMVPSHIVRLSELPRNAVGKVDRDLLPDPAVQVPLQVGCEVECSLLEKRIMEIWKDVLSLRTVGLDASFFDVGGTSLTLALVAHQLASAIGKPVETTDLFRYPTIRALARSLNDSSQSDQSVREAQDRAMRQRGAFRSRPQPAGSRNQ